MHESFSPLPLLRQVPYFRNQADEVLEALASVAIRLQFPPEAIIFTQDEPAGGLFVVEKGQVKITRISREGREHILHLIYPGDTFNDVAVLDGGPAPATAIARGDVVVWCIRRTDLQRLCERYPTLAWSLIESIAARARHLVRLAEDLATRNVRGRLAHLLLEEAKRFETDEVPRMLTQEEMAARLGTVREMVGRALRSLAGDGIIEFDRHRIVILDPERLQEEAEG
ncbi:MAG: Crp/Fnr family transcriptional regulator [Chloroflexi bacterium]|nr:MAG: Crp/Fnr family transcriptional regulator [Chloroflexota bacterium]